MKSKGSSGMKWFCDLDGNNYLIYPEDKQEHYIEGRYKKYYHLVKRISKQDILQFYIIELHNYKDCCDHFGVSRHEFRQLCDYYGIRKSQEQLNITNDAYQKKQWENMSQEEKDSWSEKQKKAHSSNEFKSKISTINKEHWQNLTDEEKELKRIKKSKGLKNAYKNDPTLYERMNNSRNENRKKRSNDLCRSKSEQQVYDKLSLHYNVVYDQIIDDRYPYYVDFYLPELDLFIEYQGHPSHGKIPFDLSVNESVDIAAKMFDNWRDVYTRRDVEKLKAAVKSNINYVRIYPSASLEENYRINSYKFTDVIDLILK